MADISKITLPSGNTYDIKDAVARQQIAGGIGFTIVWTQSDYTSTTAPTAAKLATIPKDVIVFYNNGASSATGTLAASSDTIGNFYLIYSKSQVGSEDVYNEYVTVANGADYFWEKIGDTQVDLSGVVTDVSLSKSTDTAIGTDATFTVTQAAYDPYLSPTQSSHRVPVVTGITSTSASGDSVTALTGLGTPSTSAVLTGVKVTTQPTITLTANAATATGRLKYVEDVTGGSTSPTKVHLSATASDGAVSASGDSVTALTGLGTPSKSNAVSGVSTSKLVTTTVTGVNGSTTPSVIQGRTSQTTADGTITTSTTNTDILKGATVTNETLVLGACTLDTQTTYSANAPGTITVPTAASSATTVATGSLSSSGGGGTVATGSSGTISAITAITPTTDTVLGTASTFSVTNPTITISTSGSTGPEVVGDVSDITVSPTYKYMSGSASGTAVGANGTVNAVTGYANPTTDTVLGTESAITVTPEIQHLGVQLQSYADVDWDNKDSVTVLTNATDVSVTKGTNSGE